MIDLHALEQIWGKEKKEKCAENLYRRENRRPITDVFPESPRDALE
jgi:hypothetical protein